MAGSLNRVSLIGHVGKAPEIRTMNSGDRSCNFSIATSESWTDKQSGEKKEKTEWHNVSVFNDGLVKVIENYVEKGSKLFVEGALQTRKWTDKEGNDRYSTEVVIQKFGGQLILLSSKSDDSGSRSERGGGSTNRRQSEPDNSRGKSSAFDADLSDDLDEEVPFLSQDGIR